MGTWEEESSELLESQNEINKDVSSDGTHHDGNDVEVEVYGGNGNDGGGVDESRDHVSDGVGDDGGLVERLERVKLESNDTDGSKVVEEGREQEQGYDEYDGGEGNNHYHPLRPYAVDCSFYVKTGTCKFGPNCRYNHPAMTGFQPTVGTQRGIEYSNGLVADAGKIECKYFQTPGGCKYGDACRYNHSTNKVDSDYLELNFLGLPIRPSEQECTFYLRNGSCGYGANCRFNHPDPSTRKEFESGNSLANGKSVRAGISLPRSYAGEPLQSFGGVSQGTHESPNGLNPRNGSLYAPEMSSYHQTMRPNPGWNQNQVISAFPANKTPLPHQAMNNFPKRVDPSTHYETLMQIEEFPERPGQPDCDYFMKTGNCKYRSACRYNHPTNGASKLRPPPLSSKGLYSRPGTMLPVETSGLLSANPNNMRNNGMPSTQHHQQQQQQMQNGEFPERPGQPECEYYMKTGQCKFKSACRYHHPRSRVPTPSECALSEKGLPLRPGAKLCRNYDQQGMCKYGRNCLFNHPDDHSPAVPLAAQFHSSNNVALAAANLEPPAASNGSSAWDDGWGM